LFETSFIIASTMEVRPVVICSVLSILNLEMNQSIFIEIFSSFLDSTISFGSYKRIHTSSLFKTRTKTLSIILSYLLTPWSRFLLEKLTGFAAGQEIPHILLNPKVHYRIHKCPPPVPILSQIDPA
jgi:hypothetical protein